MGWEHKYSVGSGPGMEGKRMEGKRMEGKRMDRAGSELMGEEGRREGVSAVCQAE